MARKAPIDESNLFPETNLAAPTQEQAAKISALSKARDDFGKTVLAFRSLLQDKTLSGQRTQAQKDHQVKIMQQMNVYAGDLEAANLGEGLFSLAFVSLNSLFTLRDEVNDLKFQNLMLHKRLKELNENTK